MTGRQRISEGSFWAYPPPRLMRQGLTVSKNEGWWTERETGCAIVYKMWEKLEDDDVLGVSWLQRGSQSGWEWSSWDYTHTHTHKTLEFQKSTLLSCFVCKCDNLAQT